MVKLFNKAKPVLKKFHFDKSSCQKLWHARTVEFSCEVGEVSGFLDSVSIENRLSCCN